MCLANFAISYDPVASGNYGDDGADCQNIILVHDDQHCDVTDGTRQSTCDGRTHQKQQTIKLKG